jgi:hypothetical protein
MVPSEQSLPKRCRVNPIPDQSDIDEMISIVIVHGDVRLVDVHLHLLSNFRYWTLDAPTGLNNDSSMKKGC